MAKSAKQIAAAAKPKPAAPARPAAPKPAAKKPPPSRAQTIAEQARQAPAVGLPGTSPKDAAQLARREGKAAGLKGKDLKASVQAAKGASKDAQNAAMEQQLGLAPGALKMVKNPRKFMRRVIHGKGPAMNKLMMLRQATGMLGYEEDENQLRDIMGKQVDEEGRPVMDYHEEQAPTYDEYQDYVSGHMDPETGEMVGLTPKERATYYAGQHDPIMAQAQQRYGDEQERLNAAGIDPRSGVAASRAEGIGAQTASELAEAGRKTEEANLGRKKDFEKQAGDLAALEERKRSSSTSADIERQGAIERTYGGMSELGEKERQFDVEYTEGQRQAKQRREDAEKAAKEAAPGTFEKVTAGVGGFFGGLSGGMGG
jgi:hypothetical protein